MDRAQVFKLIDEERVYQDVTGRSIEAQPHSLYDWLWIMRDYIDVAQAQERRFDEAATTDAIRKIVAVGVAAMEQYGAPARSD